MHFLYLEFRLEEKKMLKSWIWTIKSNCRGKEVFSLSVNVTKIYRDENTGYIQFEQAHMIYFHFVRVRHELDMVVWM